MGLREFFKEPPVQATIADAGKVKSMYAHWRLRIFYACFIGYTVFYLCKKNIAVALPGLSEEYGYSNTELGLLGSSLYLTYGIGKFVNGVLADGSDVRKFLPTALIMTAIANLCFGLSAVFVTPGEVSFFGLPTNTILLWLFVFFWGASGWFQSAGFPAVAKSLTYWYSNSERGTKWSLWSCSHQVGTFLSVIISGFLVAHFGWKMAFFAPGILAIIVAIWLFDRLRDRPQSLGLPDIETYNEEPAAKKADAGEADNRSYAQIFKENILCNKTIWMLAIAYIFVYIIRFGAEDWMIKYLNEAKDNSLELAAMKLSSLPLVGIAGTICAGLISDKIFKGKRAPVNLIYLVGVVCCLLLLKFNTISNIDFVLIGLLGAFTYGPQMMIGGLCAVESSSKKVASAATGFTGTFGYVGAVLSATGTGFMVDKFGWNGAIAFWIVSAIICITICTILLIDERKRTK
ncbi:MAG: MFS transporter [Cyanobacteria bacterium SIG32]|nr:MFS transporter [Cyanobacteria bacterium SIG32]